MDAYEFDFPPLDESRWRELVEGDLGPGYLERKARRESPEGPLVQALYTDGDAGDSLAARGLPGAPPYTRGGAAEAGWSICQVYDHPDPERAKALLETDLARGVEAAVLELDPTGERGILITGVDQLDALLSGVDLAKVPVSVHAGALFPAAAKMMTEVWERRGLAPADRRGGLQADPLAALAGRGDLPVPLDDLVAEAADLARACASDSPGVRAGRVATRPYHEAGAAAYQELGLLLASGLHYLKAYTAAGLDLDAAAGQLQGGFCLGTDFFMDIAKLRAARTLWARLVAEAGGSDAAQRLVIRACGSRRVMTCRDPWVNILRSVSGAFAGAVGGADKISTTPFDALLGSSGELGHRIARNVQILLREESHLARTADPAGGSWHIESLTDQLCEKGWDFFREIESTGGIVAALREGWIQARIVEVHAGRARDAARRKRAVIGVSEFPLLDEKMPDVETADLAALASAAPADGVLKAPAGEPAETVEALPLRRTAAPYEGLRDASDAHLAKTGARPKAFLANLGKVAAHTARASFASNFLAAGGIEAVGNTGFTDADAAGAAFAVSGAAMAVICGSDDAYLELAGPTAAALKAAGARTVILAGKAGENAESWREAGLDLEIHLGCDALSILRDLLRQEEVLS